MAKLTILELVFVLSLNVSYTGILHCSEEREYSPCSLEDFKCHIWFSNENFDNNGNCLKILNFFLI